MQIVTDTYLIERGQRYGRITSLVGVGVLILGLIILFSQRNNLQQSFILLVYLCLLVGFVLSNIGIYMANKWVREPREDQLLEKVLKSLDKRYDLYNYCLASQHVLTTPTGVIVFVVKRQVGTISCNGDRWHHKLTFGRALRFLTEEGIGNPSKEAKAEAAAMARFLAKAMPEEQILVTPMVVFAADLDKLSLKVENPAVAVVHLSDLRETVRQVGQDRKPLSSAVSRQLIQVLDEAAGVVA